MIEMLKIKNSDKKKKIIDSTLTRAPITPKLVNLRYSNGLALLVVLRNGYKNNGM